MTKPKVKGQDFEIPGNICAKLKHFKGSERHATFYEDGGRVEFHFEGVTPFAASNILSILQQEAGRNNENGIKITRVDSQAKTAVIEFSPLAYKAIHGEYPVHITSRKQGVLLPSTPESLQDALNKNFGADFMGGKLHAHVYLRKNRVNIELPELRADSAAVEPVLNLVKEFVPERWEDKVQKHSVNGHVVIEMPMGAYSEAFKNDLRGQLPRNMRSL